MHLGATSTLFKTASVLRKNLTPSEAILWQRISNKKLNGYRFRCQHPMLFYIVDFYCHQHRLAIEIDGDNHLRSEQEAYDDIRTKHLTEHNIKVLRFTNEEVINHIDHVLEQIARAIEEV